MGHEVELKLDLTAEAAETLADSGLLGPGRTQHLHAVYFDTPDARLRRRGLSLRIRREGRQLVQTVKSRSGPGAGLFARGEWEFPVRSLTPIIDGRSPLPGTLGRHAGELAPCFELEVERTTYALAEGASMVTAALDRATARALDRTTTFAELELELGSGHAADLFVLARWLDETAPLRIGALSKADRGVRLVGPLRTSEKAGPIALAADTGVVAACAAILGDCLHQYRVNEAILLTAPAGEALHQARVALRRLRTAHAVFAPLLKDETSARLDQQVRALAAVLGEARDLDVLWAAAEPETRAPLKDRRDHAWRAVAHALGAPATRHLLLELAEWTALGAWRDDPATADLRAAPLRGFAAAALDKRLRRVHRHGHHLAGLPDEARHTLRKDAKKLRYAAEFFSALHAAGPAGKHRRKFIAALKDLQQHLGTLNDRAVARQHLGPGTPADAAETERLLHRAAQARRTLLDCGAFW